MSVEGFARRGAASVDFQFKWHRQRPLASVCGTPAAMSTTEGSYEEDFEEESPMRSATRDGGPAGNVQSLADLPSWSLDDLTARAAATLATPERAGGGGGAGRAEHHGNVRTIADLMAETGIDVGSDTGGGGAPRASAATAGGDADEAKGKIRTFADLLAEEAAEEEQGKAAEEQAEPSGAGGASHASRQSGSGGDSESKATTSAGGGSVGRGDGSGSRLVTPVYVDPLHKQRKPMTAADALEWFAASTRVGIGRRHFAEREWHGSSSVAQGSPKPPSTLLTDETILGMVLAGVARRDKAAREQASLVAALVSDDASLPVHLPRSARRPIATAEPAGAFDDLDGLTTPRDPRAHDPAADLPRWETFREHDTDRHHEVRALYRPQEQQRIRGASVPASRARSESPPPPPPPVGEMVARAEGDILARQGDRPARAARAAAADFTGEAVRAARRRLQDSRTGQLRDDAYGRGGARPPPGSYPDDMSGAVSDDDGGREDPLHVPFGFDWEDDFEDLFRHFVQTVATVGRDEATRSASTGDGRSRARRTRVASALMSSLREVLTDAMFVRRLRDSVEAKLTRSNADELERSAAAHHPRQQQHLPRWGGSSGASSETGSTSRTPSDSRDAGTAYSSRSPSFYE